MSETHEQKRYRIADDLYRTVAESIRLEADPKHAKDFIENVLDRYAEDLALDEDFVSRAAVKKLERERSPRVEQHHSMTAQVLNEDGSLTPDGPKVVKLDGWFMYAPDSQEEWRAAIMEGLTTFETVHDDVEIVEVGLDATHAYAEVYIKLRPDWLHESLRNLKMKIDLAWDAWDVLNAAPAVGLHVSGHILNFLEHEKANYKHP